MSKEEEKIRHRLKKHGYRLHKIKDGYYQVIDENNCLMWGEESGDTLDGIIDWFEKTREKPQCKLIGENGNIFNLMGIARKTLRENGLYTDAEELVQRIPKEAHSYDEALQIIGEYVQIE